MEHMFPLSFRTLLTSLALLISLNSYAQNTNAELTAPYTLVEDPMKKPAIWEKLKKNPHNLLVWESYIGKPWLSITNYERVEVKLMRQALWVRLINNKIASTTVKQNEPPKEDFTEVMRRPTVRTFIAELEELMLTESQEMEELKENPYENFFLIEEYYTDAFKEYGSSYVPYSQKYPQGGFSEARWIEEQDKTLKNLKKQKLEALKLTFLRTQTGGSKAKTGTNLN